MCFTKIYLLQPYMDFQKITFGQSCRATCFYGVSLTCSMIRYFLSLSLEDFGNQFVLGDQLIKRFVPEGHSSESLAQYCACSCKTERLNFWLESCNQRKLMPHKKIFFQGNEVSQLWCSQCEVSCILCYQAQTSDHSAPNYCLFPFNLLQMDPFIILTGRCYVPFLQTELQCLKILSIIMAGNIFKENIGTFHEHQVFQKKQQTEMLQLNSFYPTIYNLKKWVFR